MFRDLCRYASQIVVGSTVLAVNVSVLSVAVQLRGAVAVYEVASKCVTALEDCVSDLRDSLKPVPDELYNPSLCAALRMNNTDTELTAEDLLTTDRVLVNTWETDEAKFKYRYKARIQSGQRGRFMYELVAYGKNHFGRAPRCCDSNYLSVTRLLVNRCNELHLTPTQTRNVVAEAVSLVFIPDEEEIRQTMLTNSHYAYMQRTRQSVVSTVEPWWKELLLGPSNAKNWRRAWIEICGLPEKQAISFAK
ncbi:putative replication-associated protein [Trailing lespedeza virus 1]|nr:putative replication-associated protein [Trailing lespedeza virus 1]ADY69092.2 putative replication-associated protein [Trailing lespedeza virus 1]